MLKLFFIAFLSLITLAINSQEVMTPEKLLQLGRVSAKGVTQDSRSVIYSVSKYSFETNSNKKTIYKIPIQGGEPQEIGNYKSLLKNKNISPNGKYRIITKDVSINKITGQDHYDDVSNSDVKIYDDLNYRHWDTWEDGAYSHIMYQTTATEDVITVDIMQDQPYDCPQKPFGGSEDYLWSPDSESILYVAKKAFGTNYTLSTNTDIYEYNLKSKKTINLTETNKGYDTNPSFSKNGQLAWLQMKRDGYEADKNDIIIRKNGISINVIAAWDGTVYSYLWGENGKKIFFIAPRSGTLQLFEIEVPKKKNHSSFPKQITEGQFDVHSIVGQVDNTMVVRRRDMNHASEIYTVNIDDGSMKQLTHVNDALYNSIALSTVEKRMIKTTDNKDMLTWVIYPPNFDTSKKYPTILYCKGGPQGSLSQSYSFRWNFQLMAANGYIIVAPSRRGMSGFGIEWNEQISKDYGGQNMQDYLSAIDEMSKEPYVDENRLGSVGASYGGYSVFYLAGMHEGRFKSFISHDGIFNQRSMYGTTEELFFVNWDLGGPYWDKTNAAAQRTYSKFNPIDYVDKWDTPILIIQGGKDYRVPIGQGLEAFQAAQLRGIKSRLLYFPEENHWVLKKHNSLVWQREFFRWLKETL